jgi:hypothetical protein
MSLCSLQVCLYLYVHIWYMYILAMFKDRLFIRWVFILYRYICIDIYICIYIFIIIIIIIIIITATNNTLLQLTCGILPILPILYLCRLYHLIDRNQLGVSNVLVNVFVYLIFLNSLVDEQIHVAEKIKSREEAELLANETRRTFLRYIMYVYL